MADAREPVEPAPERPTFVMVDGANELRSLRGWWWVLRHWRSLRGALVGSPGYIGHRLWVMPFRTIGLTSWWENERDAYRFAYTPAHLDFWRWGQDERHTNGGWLAVYRYEHGGPLWGNGVEALVRRFEGLVPPATGQPARRVPDRAVRRAERSRV